MARADDRDRRPPSLRRRLRARRRRSRPRARRRRSPRRRRGRARSGRRCPPGVGRPARADDGDGRAGLQRRRVAEDVQDVRWHLDRGEAARDMPGPSTVTTDSPSSRIRSSGPAASSAASAMPSATSRRRRPRHARRRSAMSRGRPSRPAGPCRPATRPRRGSPTPDAVAPQERAEPDRTEPVDAGQDRPGVALRVAGSDGAPGLARLLPRSAPARRRIRAGGPAAPTPSTQRGLDGREPQVGRPEPGGLVEMLGRGRRASPARSAIVRATRRSRSVPRPLARSSSASWTTRRSARRLEPARAHAAGDRSAARSSTPGRALQRHRAGRRDPRRDDAASPLGPARPTSASGATRGIGIHRSIRSRSGPETRRW